LTPERLFGIIYTNTCSEKTDSGWQFYIIYHAKTNI